MKVLYVQKDSPASSMKLEPGDTILKINGMTVFSEKQLTEFLSSYPTFIWMDIKKAAGEVVSAEYSDYRTGIASLGALIVPPNAEFYYEISRGSSLIKKLMEWYKRKHKSGIDI